MPGSDAMSDDLMGKIFAYVEREAGHDDVPLSTEDEAMMRWLLATDPAARALADNLRDVDTGLKGMFRAFANIPLSEDVATFTRDYGALMEEGDVQEAANLLADFKERRRKG